MKEEKSFKDFVLEKKKARGHKVMKVTNSWGIYDIFKAIRRAHWYNIGRPLKSNEFYAIVRRINLLLADNIANGITVAFPENMGTLELLKYSSGVSIKDGKLKNTYPIDWNKTLRLWYEDSEACNDKILIRNEQPVVYKVEYRKKNAKYENKGFYQFVLNRFIKRALKENIKQGKTDTLYG